MELMESQREIDTLKKKLEEKENHISLLVKKFRWGFVFCGEITRFSSSPVLNVWISFETDLCAPCRRALKSAASRQLGSFTHVKESENTVLEASKTYILWTKLQFIIICIWIKYKNESTAAQLQTVIVRKRFLNSGDGAPPAVQVSCISMTNRICFIVVLQRNCCEISLNLVNLQSSDRNVSHKSSNWLSLSGWQFHNYPLLQLMLISVSGMWNNENSHVQTHMGSSAIMKR